VCFYYKHVLNRLTNPDGDLRSNFDPELLAGSGVLAIGVTDSYAEAEVPRSSFISLKFTY
jgi:hypothetical protein